MIVSLYCSVGSARAERRIRMIRKVSHALIHLQVTSNVVYSHFPEFWEVSYKYKAIEYHVFYYKTLGFKLGGKKRFLK